MSERGGGVEVRFKDLVALHDPLQGGTIMQPLPLPWLRHHRKYCAS